MTYFKKILQLVFLVATVGVMMMGCASQKRCFKLYPPEIRSDTITVDSLVYRDTIVEVILPGDTIREEIFIDAPCPEPEDSVVLIPAPSLNSDTVRAVGTYAEAEAWVENRKLKIELIENEQVLQIKLDSVIVEARHWKTMYTVEIHKEPPSRKVPWYYRASLPVSIILMFLLLFCLRYRR